MDTLKNIFDKVFDENDVINDIVIGLHYTYVEIIEEDARNIGIAVSMYNFACGRHEMPAISFPIEANYLFKNLDIKYNLHRSIFLAYINAKLNKEENLSKFKSFLLEEKIVRANKILMIGNFAPVIKKFKSKEFVVLEKKREFIGVKGPNYEIFDVDLLINKLPNDLDLVLLTATSLINNTFDELMENLRNKFTNEQIVLLGPSTPLSELLDINLSGSIVVDFEKLKTAVKLGGGTFALKKYLEKFNVKL